jgi:NAD(P)H-dependent FMN reductase
VTKHRIAFLNGSLRKDSFHGRLGLAIAAAASERLDVRRIEIGDLPLYNQDKDGDAAPAQYAAFRQAIAGCDGLLFGSPEYNRGITGALKNAIDVGLWQERLREEASGGVLGLAGDDRRVWVEPCVTPVLRVPRRAGDAAARGLLGAT